MRDATWLAHRYEPGRDAIHFRRLTRAQHRSLTFLTEDELPKDAPAAILPRAAVIAAAGQTAPLHFIFHSAFCGSTLLARALDIEGVSMGLKEPVLLNDASGLRKLGAEPSTIAKLFSDALTLLARPFQDNEAVIIKPSNVINGYLPLMLTMRPASHALLLYAPLPVFVGSVARKGLWGRLWVRELLSKLIPQGLVDLGFTSEDYFRLTDLQVAAVGWLAQHALFARLGMRFPGRVRTLDSETLMQRPEETISAIGLHFGLPLGAAGIVKGQAFTRHSKFGQPFDAAARVAERTELELPHADEISKVLRWAEAVASNASLDLQAPAPLLD
jgi:hypothetical protein